MKYNEETTLSDFSRISTNSWEEIKDKVFINLINFKVLSEYGDDIFYTKIADLAMLYGVKEKTQNNDNYGVQYYYFTNEDIKKYNVTVEEFKNTALKNSANDKKKRLLLFSEHASMRSTFYPLLILPENATLGISTNKDEQLLGRVVDCEDGKENILVLSNKIFPFGASYMFLPTVLNEVRQRFQNENYYILPMSRHQAWYVRESYVSKNGQKKKEYVEDDLLDMVEEYNDKNNQSWRDVLSYKIYYYMGDECVIIPIS